MYGRYLQRNLSGKGVSGIDATFRTTFGCPGIKRDQLDVQGASDPRRKRSRRYVRGGCESDADRLARLSSRILLEELLLLMEMYSIVTTVTQCDQVFFCIVASPTAELLMVCLKILHCSAMLDIASRPISELANKADGRLCPLIVRAVAFVAIQS